MPIISHSELPSFKRLQSEGEIVLSKDRANNQQIRELHIGLLNMMPDAALEATERQFLRLIGHSNQIAQFYLHPFTLVNIDRSEKIQTHIDKYYKDFEQIKHNGLDALIITGANIEKENISDESFFTELTAVVHWAYDNVTSTLCSCFATHAVMQIFYQQQRQRMPQKYWGVFQHTVIDRSHPLMNGIDTIFNVPHSRFNQITQQQFMSANAKMLVVSEVGVHLAVSKDLLRIVFFQGHPEYDTVSILKEYKREVIRFLNNERDYPEFPKNYFDSQAEAILLEFKEKLINNLLTIADFPEKLIMSSLNNTWASVTNSIINNWIGLVYQTTNVDVKKPFMDSLDIQNPLGL